MKKWIIALGLLVGFLNPAQASTLINGAGATFPYPIYSKWFSEYHKAKPQVQINYQSIGSGGGIKQFQEKTVDFGASDAPMKDEDLEKATKAKQEIVHIPTIMGAVVLTYNVPGVSADLKLTGQNVADIYLGKIKKWNDAQIKASNSSVELPDLDIAVIRRSDGSGTTFVFTDYLSKVSPEWKKELVGPAIEWPTGIGSKGNEGVTNSVKQTPGAIGYVELVYAEKNKLSYASIKNSSGEFVKPSPDSVTEAAKGAKIPADYRVSITNAPGKKSYPISSFTYLLVWKELPADKGQAIKDFLKWSMKEGQKHVSTWSKAAKEDERLSYSALPAALAERVLKTIESLKVKSQKNS